MLALISALVFVFGIPPSTMLPPDPTPRVGPAPDAPRGRKTPR